MLSIDGSQGEGGGQIIRTSLALALVTGRAVTVNHIRAGRAKPGLQRQHLTAVQAAAKVGRAEVVGDQIGSLRLVFTPTRVTPGDYPLRIGSAGSTTLVLQTVLPALMLSNGPSTLSVEGGTHNPFAPPFEFIERAYLPLVAQMGPQCDVTLERYGFYPAGGGGITASVRPTKSFGAFELLDRGKIIRRRVRAIVANLPRHIAERECQTFARKSNWDRDCFEVVESTDSPGPGNVFLVEVACENVTEVFTAFGQRGVRAESVATRAWNAARRYIKAEVPVGEHLADQLLLPMGIGAWMGTGGGRFRTTKLSTHSTTHIDLLRQFLEVTVKVTDDPDGKTLVEVTKSGD